MPITQSPKLAVRIVALSIAAASTLLLAAPAGAVAAPATAPETAAVPTAQVHTVDASAVSKGASLWVTAKFLQLRTGPANGYKITAGGYRDARVVATGKRSNGWIEVKIAGVRAWAPAKFFTFSKPGWDPIRVGTTAKSLELRARPTSGSDVVATASRGSKAIFTRVQKNGWWEVKIDGVYAWTPQKFLNVGGYYNRSRLLSVMHGEVGYREPAWRVNKYNSWIGGSNAWCSVFVSWAFDRAGYPAGVPYRDHFDNYVADLRRAGVLDTSVTASDLKRGDVVLIDWYPYNGPTHTGTVDHVDGSTVWLVEGNTNRATGVNGRGVWYRQRNIVDVYAVYDPTEYARATMLW
ncbi:SH3 domain-containing protein [Demequina gelatinilytica]|uniref:SH3 domain-containing protein n=1 Tax=Demequina gelatinilytica TaxID=1638980 RepID=UPI000784077A|nr:CHAP domain-containing protein [Demequina gelatinilytica]